MDDLDARLVDITIQILRDEGYSVGEISNIIGYENQILGLILKAEIPMDRLFVRALQALSHQLRIKAEESV